MLKTFDSWKDRSKEVLTSSAYKEGIIAHQEGKKSNDCPYDALSKESNAWRTGYSDIDGSHYNGELDTNSGEAVETYAKMKITLWKENKLSQEYILYYSDLFDKFINSDFYKEDYLKNEMTLDHSLRCFLTFKEGLNSSYDVDDPQTYHELYVGLKFMLEAKEL